MADIVTPDVRSRMMSAVRGKDTKPELVIRRALHARGFRYRLHSTRLPGKPDLVLPRYRAALFVHGCFWHGHDCHLFRLPGTRREFWEAKIARNRSRDREVRTRLHEDGWRQVVIWECAIRGRGRMNFENLMHGVSLWLTGDSETLEIRGRN